MAKILDPIRQKKKDLDKLASQNALLKKSLEKLIQEVHSPKTEPKSVIKTLRVENKKAQVKFLRYFLIFLVLVGYIIYMRLR